MLLYLFGEYSSRWDADFSLWLFVSLIVRVAFRTGYHRDAKWFSNITPFQAVSMPFSFVCLRTISSGTWPC